MGRKYLALAGALCIVAVTAGGCKSSEEETVKNIKIGVTLYDQYDTFLSEMMTEFTEYAADKEEESKVTINLEILDASKSQLTQNEQVKSLIEKGFLNIDKSGKRAIYIPSVSSKKFYENYAKEIVDDSYEGSLKNFICAFTKGRKLTGTEKEDLLAYIQTL